MKKTLVSILLLIWLLQCSLPTLVYLMGLEQIKHRHQLGHYDEPLQRLVFQSGEQIHWLEQDKEFELQGRRYDVSTIKDSAGFVVIQAYADTGEDRLLADYHQSSAEDSKDKAWLKQWNKFKLFAYSEDKPTQFIGVDAGIHPVFVSKMPAKVFMGVLDPPPDIL